MNEKKRFLFLDVGLPTTEDLAEKLQAALQARGAEVESMPLAGNYDAVLDRLLEGAVPVVLKH